MIRYIEPWTKFIVVVAALISTSLQVQAKEGKNDWKKVLDQNLDASYPPTRTSLNSERIKQAGVVLVIQKEGLSGVEAGSGSAMNEVKDGVIKQTRTAGNILMGSSPRRSLKVGERLYVTLVNPDDEEIKFSVLSVDTYDTTRDGNTVPTRYQATIKFEFPKDYLSTADFSEVKAAINSIFASEDEIKNAPSKTVQIGQTPEQVEAILGKPKTTLKGANGKMIYVYDGTKIIFQDDKVADFQ